MSNGNWKYKELPRASGLVAPAYWNPGTEEWEVYEGDTNIVKELEEIKQQQNEILERLDEPIPTQVTGSNVGYSDDEKPSGNKGDSFLELDTLDVYINDGAEWVILE